MKPVYCAHGREYRSRLLIKTLSFMLVGYAEQRRNINAYSRNTGSKSVLAYHDHLLHFHFRGRYTITITMRRSLHLLLNTEIFLLLDACRRREMATDHVTCASASLRGGNFVHGPESPYAFEELDIYCFPSTRILSHKARLR
jgi:hypothetical protein